VKVIFLDFDGPIIPSRVFALNQGLLLKTPDPLAGAMINEALQLADAKIVVSSSWRRDGIDTCREVLRGAKIDVTRLHPDWHTPIGPSRKEAILQWVDAHFNEIDTWVAIDDAVISLDPENYVHVSTRNGFLYEDYIELCKKLGVKPHGDC
jgi:hypothetical protein